MLFDTTSKHHPFYKNFYNFVIGNHKIGIFIIFIRMIIKYKDTKLFCETQFFLYTYPELTYTMIPTSSTAPTSSTSISIMAVMYLYDMSGRLIREQSLPPGVNHIYAPSTVGVYELTMIGIAARRYRYTLRVIP